MAKFSEDGSGERLVPKAETTGMDPAIIHIQMRQAAWVVGASTIGSTEVGGGEPAGDTGQLLSHQQLASQARRN